MLLNHKRLFRLYREGRLGVRKRGGGKRALGTRSPVGLLEAANQRWSLTRARRIVEVCRIDYNTARPHTSLNGLTPATCPQQGYAEQGPGL